MRFAALGSAVVTALLLLTTMVCGLWIRSNDVTDAGSLDFHVASGIASVASSLVTLILVVALSARRPRGR